MSANQPTASASDLLSANGPVCLVIKAQLKPVGDTDRFQPAGFPEVGHVIYDAPRGNQTKQKVCIVDSPASMANHLETVCLAAAGSLDLHDDLKNLPYVICETDDTNAPEDTAAAQAAEPKVGEGKPSGIAVCSTFSEGHRLASDYFLDSVMNPKWVDASTKTVKGKDEKEKVVPVPAHWGGIVFREQLRKDFKIIEVKKDKTYFIPPETWWSIFGTIFKYDPNSLVHGVMFAQEQIKLSRLLTAHLEAFGASRVGRSGVKFDQLGKTLSGQPIFSVDEETAESIQATFIIDLGLLRSYGRGDKGLTGTQKQLLLDLALWKVKQLLARPFRYRTQCFLGCTQVEVETENGPFHPTPKPTESESPKLESDSPKTHEDTGLLPSLLKDLNIRASIAACRFSGNQPTRVYYLATDLFKAGKDNEQAAEEGSDDGGEDAGDDDQ